MLAGSRRQGARSDHHGNATPRNTLVRQLLYRSDTSDADTLQRMKWGGLIRSPEPAESWQVWGASWWDAAQALGTLAAVLLALGLAIWEARRHRTTRLELEALKANESTRIEEQQAGLVSAWVESEYAASSDGSHYEQRSVVHVANEGTEPVFNVHVVVGIGNPIVQLGPISVPVPIPVLPPRRVRSWDISLAVMANSDPVGVIAGEPVARVDFSNAGGVRWHRNYEGILHRSNGASTPLFDRGVEEGEKQLGDLTNAFNPMQVAYAFFGAAVDDSPPPVDEIRVLLASTAPAWSHFGEAEWEHVRDQISPYGLAAHVYYPAPRVAYVRLIHDDDTDKEVSEAGYVEVRALVVTLVFLPGEGWRIFSVGAGATRPDWIGFPIGSLNQGLRGDAPEA